MDSATLSLASDLVAIHSPWNLRCARNDEEERSRARLSPSSQRLTHPNGRTISFISALHPRNNIALGVS
ncbi:protein of unknown function [Bradyrhizobium vignae]|uniref:Uncharacterized protein n=1 Tax=Bradyrhizobium vignae TaxID=1549949 RepID=A0A2U3Q4V3_9BRAD|nr:protein of unknown function [Bradyrhizobium vignae]